MTKVDFQVNTEAEGGDGNGQGHRAEDAKLQRLGVDQQLKVYIKQTSSASIMTISD